MPNRWTPPELFLTHSNGVKVWHTYKEFGGNASKMEYWYTTYEAEDDAESGSAYIFDVRDLDGVTQETVDIMRTSPNREQLHREIITHAISQGKLRLPFENRPKDYPQWRTVTVEKQVRVCPDCSASMVHEADPDARTLYTWKCPACKRKI